MPQFGESLGPVVRAVRSLHPNNTGWEVCGRKSRATQSLAQNAFAALVNAMKMKDIFREIKADTDDFHGRLLFCV